MLEAVLFIGAYLVGAVPVGYLIARAHGVNIFQVWSGNVGATNIKRALGMKWALAVFALDVLKGVIPTCVALALTRSPEWSMGVGCAAIAGHCYSPFLKFKGGKGISTALGVALSSAPLVAMAAFAVFVVVLALTRWVSLSSMVAVPSGILFGWLFGESPALLVFYGVVSLFIILRHRANIERLLNGTESKFSLGGSGKKKDIADEGDEKDRSDMSYRPHWPFRVGGGTRA